VLKVSPKTQIWVLLEAASVNDFLTASKVNDLSLNTFVYNTASLKIFFI